MIFIWCFSSVMFNAKYNVSSVLSWSSAAAGTHPWDGRGSGGRVSRYSHGQELPPPGEGVCSLVLGRVLPRELLQSAAASG